MFLEQNQDIILIIGVLNVKNGLLTNQRTVQTVITNAGHSQETRNIRCLQDMDSRECCNIDCPYYVRKNKIRCGKCNGKRDYRCAMCNSELRESKKIFCSNCITIRNHPEKSNIWVINKCKICHNRLVGNQRKYCSRKCHNKYLCSQHYKICPMCFTPKELGSALCEGDCKRMYFRLMKQMYRGVTYMRPTIRGFIRNELKKDSSISRKQMFDKLM